MSVVPGRKRFRTRTALWLVCGGLVLALFIAPIQTNLGRYLSVGGLLGLWIAGLRLFWRRPRYRWIFLTPLAPALIMLFMPRVPSDPDAMRVAYLSALRSYVGTPYLWGGESRIGADCSGMLRRAMMDALVSEGLRRNDMSALRTAVALWWFDASAFAMSNEHQQRTIFQFEAENLNELHDSRLLPGDMAVVMDGKHILAYLGDNQWIDADPVKGKTVIETTPTSTIWFTLNARIVRWRRLIE
ncbi:MAG: NlpC/P60 family protein [Armatimonas sp.]